MPSEYPPRPSGRLKIAVAAVLLVTFAYSVLVTQQILPWFLLVGVVAGVYVVWLLAVAVFRTADAAERIADAMEAGGGEGGRVGDPDDGDDGDRREGGPTEGDDRRVRDIVEERDDRTGDR